MRSGPVATSPCQTPVLPLPRKRRTTCGLAASSVRNTRNSGAEFLGPRYAIVTSGDWPGSRGAITLGVADRRVTLGGVVSTRICLDESITRPSSRRTTRIR